MVHIKTHTGVRLHFNADRFCCHHSRTVTVPECPTGEVLLLRRLPKGHNAICTIHGSQLVPSQRAPLVGPGHIALYLPRELPQDDDGLTQYDGEHGKHGERHWPEHQTAQENHGMQEGKGKGGPVQSDAADGVEQCVKEAPTELIEFTSRRKASMM
ncbi:hypothetical protein B0H14DRAFT_2558389 [Mycena olivaceomarginata]|nr:hypothetical protein B0H14DRAFT_2558389 [Mycena olivaceomarginata]